MSDSKDSKAYVYKESVGFEPKYKYVKVTPAVSRDETIGIGQSRDYNIDTLDSCINYARSYVQYDYKMPWGMSMATVAIADASSAAVYVGIFENIKAPPYFHGVVFQPDKTTTAVINITNNLQDINQQIKPYTMTFDEYQARDSLNSNFFPSMTKTYNALITTANSASTASAITCDSRSGITTNIYDPQYFKSNYYCNKTAGSAPLTATDTAFSETGVKVSLKDLSPRSLFGIDKVIPPSSKGIGQITFTMGFPERSVHTYTNTDQKGGNYPQGPTGTIASYGTGTNGSLTVSNFCVYFCVETNKEVEQALKNEVNSSNGWSLHIPYCVFNQNTLTTRTNHSVNYTIEPGYGSYLREVYLSPQYVDCKIGSYRYDFNNLADSSVFNVSDTSASNYASLSPNIKPAKIHSYHVEIDSEREQQYDIVCENKEDYIYAKNSIGNKKTAILTPLQFAQNFVIYTDFTKGTANTTPTAFIGKILGDKRVNYKCEANTAYTYDATTGAKGTQKSSSFNWNMTIVYGRTMRYTSTGVTLI